jgi:hypothetical protein
MNKILNYMIIIIIIVDKAIENYYNNFTDLELYYIAL